MVWLGAVLSLPELRSNVLVKLWEVTARTHALPMVLFAPTSRCNSRCVSCDWWRSDGKSDLALDESRAPTRLCRPTLVRWVSDG
jgi:hypothetical protein